MCSRKCTTTIDSTLHHHEGSFIANLGFLLVPWTLLQRQRESLCVSHLHCLDYDKQTSTTLTHRATSNKVILKRTDPREQHFGLKARRSVRAA